MTVADLCRLFDICLPHGGYVAVLEAYFDESERSSGLFSVAGFAFAREQAKKFSKEWAVLFRDFGGACHMSELAAGNGRFKHVHKTERARLCKGAVKIFNRRAQYGVAVSCYVQEMHHYLPRWVKGFEHAYPVCCHMAAIMMGAHIKNSAVDDSIAYVFESGHRFASSAQHMMSYASNGTPEVKESYRYVSHAFVPKDEAPPLQAADLFAWEWAKYRDETVDKKIRPVRQSLRAIVGTVSPDCIATFDKRRFGVTHLEGERLAQFSMKVAQLAVIQD
jgi:hypothetical protein